MKLNKKKWFNKNVLEFRATYWEQSSGKGYTLMSYNKYCCYLGDKVDYNFMWDNPPVVNATSRKLSTMKLHEAYFFLRYLQHKYPQVTLKTIKISDALK